MNPSNFILFILFFFLHDSVLSQTRPILFKDINVVIDVDSIKNIKPNGNNIISLKQALLLEYSYEKNSRNEFGMYFNKIDKIVNKSDYKNYKNILFYLKGRYHLRNNKLDYSFDLLNKSLQGFYAENDTLGVLFSLRTLTWIYTNNSLDEYRDLQKAEAYAKQAFDFSVKSKDPDVRYLGLSCLILVYGHEPVQPNRFKEVIFEQMKLIKLYPVLEKYRGITFVNLSSYYDMINDARRFKFLALVKRFPRNSFDSDFNYLATQHNIAVSELYLKDYISAEQGFSIVVQYRGNANISALKADAFKGLREVYIGLNDYKKALMFADSNYSTKDQIYKEQVVDRLNQVEIAFKTKEIQKSNLFLKKEYEYIQNRNIIVSIFLFITVLLLIFLSLLLHKFNKSKFKLEKTYQEIKLLLDLKDKYFRIVSHDLRQPFVSYQGLASSLKYLVKKGDLSQIDELSSQIDLMGSRITLILHNLLVWGKFSLSDNQKKKKLIPIIDLMVQLIPLYAQLASLRGVQFRNLFNDDNFLFFGDYEEIETIFRNAYDNAIKNTPKDGIVTCSGNLSNGTYHVRIANSLPISSDYSKISFISNYINQGEISNDDRIGLGLQLILQFSYSNGIPVTCIYSSGLFELNFSFKLAQKDVLS